MKRLIAYPLLLSATSVVLPVVVDSAVKGFVLTLAAAIGMLALRKTSASLRHLLWVSAMAGLVALPIMSFVLPSWRVLPSWIDDSVAALSDVSEASVPAVIELQVAEVTSAVVPPSLRGEAEALTDHTATESEFVATTGPTTEANAVAAAPRMQGRVTAILIIALWMTGAAFLLARLTLSTLVLSRLAFKSRRLTCGRVYEELQTLRHRLGIRRDVQILQSDRRTVPTTWGVLKARVLLPTDSDSWDSERLRAVLLHELAHVKRCDPIMHLLVQITCALHWFNPMVWIAAWRIRVERERACDDVVLNAGMKPSDYAQHLLGIATGYVGREFAGLSAVAMARKARLEGRLVSMLDGKLSRRELSLRAIALSGLATAAIVLPVAMMQAADDAKDSSQSQEAPHAETPREQLRSPASSDRQAVQSVYQNQLLELAKRSGWRDVRVELSGNQKRRDADRRFVFCVKGRAAHGELKAVIEDICSLYARNQHEIRSISIKPVEGSKELMSITAEVSCLPDEDRAEVPLDELRSPASSDRQAVQSVYQNQLLELAVGSGWRDVRVEPSGDQKRRDTDRRFGFCVKGRASHGELIAFLKDCAGHQHEVRQVSIKGVEGSKELISITAEVLCPPDEDRPHDASTGVVPWTDLLGDVLGPSVRKVPATAKGLEPRTVQGRVLTPDGKPVGGARAYAWSWNWVLNHDTCQVEALTDEDGSFDLSLPSEPETAYVVCAIADGFGSAIGFAAPHLTDGDMVHAMYGVKQDGSKQPKGTLLLSKDDTPITGRVVDVEGRPVRRATVRVSGMSEGYNVDLTDWLNYMKGNNSDKPPMHFFAVPKVKEFSAATDDEGNFQLRGIGRERVIQLLIAGESIECRGIYVVTRKEPSFSAPRHPDGVKAVVDFTYHGPTFVHIAGPTTPVVGVVRDADTNAPLPGVRVRPARLAGIPIDNSSRYGYIEAVTDEHGRYRLVGLPKGVNLIEAVPAHVPDLDVGKVCATSTADTSSGGDKPVQADVLYLKR